MMANGRGNGLTTSVVSTTTLHGSTRLTVGSISSERLAKSGLQIPRIFNAGRSTPSFVRSVAATSISVSTPNPCAWSAARPFGSTLSSDALTVVSKLPTA